MEKNTLYEVLEVSEKASQEIIEKAYKTLAKKYHPDLQDASGKKNAEAMMKKINEAYEVLGDKEKRKAYDAELQAKRDAEELREQELEKQKINRDFERQASNNFSQHEQQPAAYGNDLETEKFDNNENFDYEKERIKYEKKLQKEEIKQRKKMQENLNKEYQNAYENYLRNLGYRVKHRWTKENFRDFFIVIGIMIIIFIVLWIIPPTRQWLINFYNSNPLLKSIVDVLIAVVTGIFKGIWSFITGLFN